MFIIQFIRGFCMALADSVPGVSGGTIAFLLGFYDKFIDSIDDLLTGTKEDRKDAFVFLIKLGIGWISGFVIAVLILTSVFESHIYYISSLFIGFIIFAIPIVIKEEKKCLGTNKKAIPFVLLGIAVVCAITYFNPVSGGNDGVNLDHLTPGLAVFVFFAGVIAISVITAIKDMLHLAFSSFWTVFIFGCGVLVGIFSVVKLIRRALEKYRAQTIYLIIGLMLGSIFAVVMGPTTLDTPQPAMGIHDFSILFFLIGGAVILGLQKMKDIKQ